MADLIGYDQLVQQAMRDMVRQALADLAVQGLPADHCLHIKFPINYPGVIWTADLGPVFDKHKDKDNEVTIAVEGASWHLVVTRGSITLIFQDMNSHRLTIPFNAITGFYDVVARFGFQLEALPPDPDDGHKIIPFKKPA
jgi:hypothetical protein